MKTCRSCAHLRRFELADELFTCAVVNIRIHATMARVFGCNFHEKKPRVKRQRAGVPNGQ